MISLLREASVFRISFFTSFVLRCLNSSSRDWITASLSPQLSLVLLQMSLTNCSQLTSFILWLSLANSSREILIAEWSEPKRWRYFTFIGENMLIKPSEAIARSRRHWTKDCRRQFGSWRSLTVCVIFCGDLQNWFSSPEVV